MEIVLEFLSRLRGNTYVSSTLVLAALVVFFYFNYSTQPYRGIPYVGGPRWDILNLKAQYRFVTDCKKLIQEGLAKYDGQPFQIIGFVPIVVLPPRYVPLIKDHPNLDFGKSAEKRLFGQYPGLDWAHKINEDRIFQESLRINMTQYLSEATPLLAEEAREILDDFFPQSHAWTPFVFGKHAGEMGVRLSTLVFLGKKFTRNKEWLYICTQYPEGIFGAVGGLLSTPKLLRPFLYRYLPQIKALQKYGKVARDLILPEVEERERLRATGADIKFNDALEWYYKNSAKRGKEDFDAVSAMISLAFASTHTTVDLLCNVLYDLAAHPECVEPLRAEIERVLAEDGGWKKTTLYKMRLMDSFLKESQRMNPVQLTAMNRYVKETTILSDGTKLPKGSLLAVSLSALRDPRQFEDPDRFDGFRFARRREQPGQENQWQFTSTRNEFYSFGHGQWSCPGRFLVGNELKIFLAELLLRYDLKYPEGVTRPEPGWFATESQVDMKTPVLFRLREKV